MPDHDWLIRQARAVYEALPMDKAEAKLKCLELIHKLLPHHPGAGRDAGPMREVTAEVLAELEKDVPAKPEEG